VAHYDVVDCNLHVGFEFLSAVLAKIKIFRGNDSASSSKQFPKFRRVSVLLSSTVKQSENNAA
jgi:hypothetical protein